MTCEGSDCVEFNIRACLLDWEHSVDRTSNSEIESNTESERVDSESRDRQHPDQAQFKPTLCAYRTETESNILNGKCLVDDASLDATSADAWGSLTTNKAYTGTSDHTSSASHSVDNTGSRTKCHLPETTVRTILDIPLVSTQKKVQAKLAWAEQEVEVEFQKALATLGEKKAFLQGKLKKLRRKGEEEEREGEDGKVEENYQKSQKSKPSIDVVASPRPCPISGGAVGGVGNESFVREKDILKLELMLNEIEEVVQRTNSISMAVRRMTYMTPFLEITLPAQVDTDAETPNLVDVIVITVNNEPLVLVTDFKNMSLKALPNQTRQVNYGVVKFRNSPWGIARLDDNRVAVSVPVSNNVCLVEVSKSLRLKETVRTKKQYYGIVSLSSGNLAGTSPYSSPRSVDIFSLTGSVLKTLVVDSFLQKPSFICKAPTGRIVVSDLIKGVLLYLSGDLEHIEGFDAIGVPQLSSSRGIATNSSGDVFVVDYQQKTVKVFSGKGEFVKNFLSEEEGMNYPYGVCFDEQGLCYVTDGGVVKIFSY